MRSVLQPLSALFLAGFFLAGCESAPPALMLSEAERASGATLVEGDRAPALAIGEWVRGGPVSGFEPGMVYVVDFWATWCGPCLASMPRTSNLQDRTRGRVVVIGVTTVDEDNSAGAVRNLVRKNQRSMRFAVAIDEGDQTARRYRTASRETALPHTFVIDQQGRLAWHGHPVDAEPVVDAVLAGTWDVAAARRERDRRQAAGVESELIVREYIAAVRARDTGAQLACAERGVRIPVEYMRGMSPEYWAWTARVSCLAELGRAEEARSAAEEAAGTPGVRDNHYGMAELAQAIKPVSLDDASGYADRAMTLVREMEARPASDEWDEFLADAEERRAAGTRLIVADICASQARWGRAAELLREAIDRWPDGERYIPNKAQLRQRLAGYEKHAGGGR